MLHILGGSFWSTLHLAMTKGKVRPNKPPKYRFEKYVFINHWNLYVCVCVCALVHVVYEDETPEYLPALWRHFVLWGHDPCPHNTDTVATLLRLWEWFSRFFGPCLHNDVFSVEMCKPRLDHTHGLCIVWLTGHTRWYTKWQSLIRLTPLVSDWLLHMSTPAPLDGDWLQHGQGVFTVCLQFLLRERGNRPGPFYTLLLL